MQLPLPPFFIGFGLLFPMPLLVMTGTANPGNGALGLLGIALMLIGLYRGFRNSAPDFVRMSAVADAAEEAHDALLEAGDDPRAADSLRNRIRSLADLKAL